MTYLVSPFNSLSRDVNRLFGDDAVRSQLLAERDWTPNIDIRETEHDFQVVADLPGVSADDIDISLHSGVLTIQGERKLEKEVDEKNVFRRERFHGRFVRQFNLPETANSTGITAHSSDGVLTVTIPKTEKAKPISITVNQG